MPSVTQIVGKASRICVNDTQDMLKLKATPFANIKNWRPLILLPAIYVKRLFQCKTTYCNADFMNLLWGIVR